MARDREKGGIYCELPKRMADEGEGTTKAQRPVRVGDLCCWHRDRRADGEGHQKEALPRRHVGG